VRIAAAEQVVRGLCRPPCSIQSVVYNEA